jgi:hypothetical protein
MEVQTPVPVVLKGPVPMHLLGHLLVVGICEDLDGSTPFAACQNRSSPLRPPMQGCFCCWTRPPLQAGH